MNDLFNTVLCNLFQTLQWVWFKVTPASTVAVVPCWRPREDMLDKIVLVSNNRLASNVISLHSWQHCHISGCHFISGNLLVCHVHNFDISSGISPACGIQLSLTFCSHWHSAVPFIGVCLLWSGPCASLIKYPLVWHLYEAFHCGAVKGGVVPLCPPQPRYLWPGHTGPVLGDPESWLTGREELFQLEGLGLLACVLQIVCVCVRLIQDVCQKWECTFSKGFLHTEQGCKAEMFVFCNPDAVKTIQTIIEELRELHTTFCWPSHLFAYLNSPVLCTNQTSGRAPGSPFWKGTYRKSVFLPSKLIFDKLTLSSNCEMASTQG